MVDDKTKAVQLIEALEQARNSKVLVYWTGDLARITDAVTLSLYDQLERIGHVPQLDLVLVTRGGDVDVPWRIVSLIREYCDRFAVLVPYRAASAGTMIALGADEIVMTSIGVLGPIDPSRAHPLLPNQNAGGGPIPQVSVQDLQHAMSFVRRPSGQDGEMAYTPDAMAHIFSSLFEKIHPLAIGALEQSYALAKLVARLCLETHMDPTNDKAQIDSIVNRLCDYYKSHTFPINRSEARSIGLKVVDAPPAVSEAMINLLKFYLARPVFPGGKPTPNTITAGDIAWLESTGASHRVQSQYAVDAKGVLNFLSDSGWTEY